ncbi:RNA-binding CRS1 / YhbY (CRM) domain protein, partial [Striga hermonthica]
LKINTDVAFFKRTNPIFKAIILCTLYMYHSSVKSKKLRTPVPSLTSPRVAATVTDENCSITPPIAKTRINKNHRCQGFSPLNLPALAVTKSSCLLPSIALSGRGKTLKSRRRALGIARPWRTKPAAPKRACSSSRATGMALWGWCESEQARIKETLLIERLKRYEVPKAEGPVVEPHVLTGEERYYMKKMAQKRSNYVPIGRRGIFGGVILNMHMHWKKHETVKVICKPCKPGQVQEYADEIARLSGGLPIQIIADDTIIFYRGKNYVQPKVMSPVDTLSKKWALEKSKYEQSLESLRRFIAIAEKELELYYRHVALYGSPNDRDPNSILDNPRTESGSKRVKTYG